MSKWYMKKCSTSLIRKRQIKPSMGHHLTPIINKIRDNKCSQNVEKREPLYTVGGNISWLSYYGKQYGGSSKENRTGLLAKTEA